MIKIVICDDDKEYLSQIKNSLKDHFHNVSLSYYTKGHEILNKINSSQKYDIYILDIEMPEVDGMSLSTKIKKVQPNAIVILLSGYTKYVFDSFEIGIFRYIPKNETEIRLIKAIDDAIKVLDTSSEYFLIKNSLNAKKIFYKDIIFIYKNKNDVIFSTTEQEIVYKNYSINHVTEELKNSSFIQVERGYIINIAYLERIDKNNAIMKNGTAIPISRRKMNELKKALLDYWSSLI